MALKGHTKIELTDVNTGKKEVYEDDNLVTNALSSLLNSNYFGFESTDVNTNKTWMTRYPIIGNALGGVLLYQDSIEENKDTYFAENNTCIGYANQVVNDTEDVKRGSPNLTESGEIDNGYKFVWDFETSQANGTISSVCLTSNYGGYAENGAGYNDQYVFYCPNNLANLGWNFNTLGYTNDEKLDYLYSNRGIVEVNPDENYMVTINRKGADTILIRKTFKPFNNIKFNHDYTTPDSFSEVLNETEISVTTSATYYEIAYDNDNAYVIDVETMNGDTALTLQVTTIPKSDYTEHSTQTIDVTDYSIRWKLNGYAYGLKVSEEIKIGRHVCTVRDGFLYLFGPQVGRDYSNIHIDTIYKVNLSNVADITAITLPEVTKIWEFYQMFPTIFTIGDNVYIGSGSANSSQSKNMRIDYNDNATLLSYNFNTNHGYNAEIIKIDDIWYLMNLYYNSYNLEYKLITRTPYLATINNLSEPVTKTASKTMKITYTLTFE